ATLADSVKALLGVNLVERLQADLTIYQSRLIRSNRSDGTSTRLDEIDGEVQEAEKTLATKTDAQTNLEAELGNLRDQLARAEQAIASEGGGFAKRREGLIKKREEARAALKVLEGNVRQLCGGLLPFALAPGLMRELRRQLVTEQGLQAADAGRAMLASTKRRLG